VFATRRSRRRQVPALRPEHRRRRRVEPRRRPAQLQHHLCLHRRRGRRLARHNVQVIAHLWLAAKRRHPRSTQRRLSSFASCEPRAISTTATRAAPLRALRPCRDCTVYCECASMLVDSCSNGFFSPLGSSFFFPTPFTVLVRLTSSSLSCPAWRKLVYQLHQGTNKTGAACVCCKGRGDTIAPLVAIRQYRPLSQLTLRPPYPPDFIPQHPSPTPPPKL